MVDQERIWDFVSAMSSTTKETTTKMQASVANVDKDGTVWVMLPGSDRETPTEKPSTEVARGDTVTVEWRAGKLYIVGNTSNPSAGTSRVASVESAAQQAWAQAYSAKRAADNAQESAQAASEAAADAKETAEGVEAIAQQAQEDASAASAAASAASTAAAAADTKATNAASAAAAAQTSADNAATAAATADQKATAASTAATQAQTDAAAAQTAASNAQTAASSAQTSAQQAVADAATAGRAASVAQAAAEAAQGDVDELEEWFWHDTNGSHVLGATSGYRNDIDSTGMTIVETASEDAVASFGADGAQIGKDTATNLTLDADGMRLVSEYDEKYIEAGIRRYAEEQVEAFPIERPTGNPFVNGNWVVSLEGAYQEVGSIVSVELNASPFAGTRWAEVLSAGTGYTFDASNQTVTVHLSGTQIKDYISYVTSSTELWLFVDYMSTPTTPHPTLLIGDCSARGDLNELAFAIGHRASIDDYGRLKLSDTDMERNVPPSSNQWIDRIALTDAYGTLIGYIRTPFMTDGREGIQIETKRTVNGTTKYNGITMYFDANNEPTVVLGQPAAWRDAMGAVNKAGDTMTGELYLEKSSGNTYLHVRRSDTNVEVGLGVGSGGTNHGVYSMALNKWLLYGDASNVYAGAINVTSAATARSSIGHNFTWEIDTNNTTDTWVPVLRNGALQHRVIPTAYNSTPLALNAGGTGQTGITTVTTISQVITAGSGITINSVRYSVWGKVVSLYVSFKRSSAIPANGTVTVGTVVSGKRPTTAVGGGSYHMAGYIEADGTITLRNVQGSQIAADTNRGVGFTYLLP